MSDRVKIRENQNLWDVALQERGSIAAALEIALENGLTLTDAIAPGTELLIPDGSVDTDMMNHYKSNRIEPATK